MGRRALGVALVGLALLAGPGPGFGQAYPCPGLQRTVVAYAFEQITVSTTAIGFTVATMVQGSSTPVMAVVSLDATNGIRSREDGTNPTATVGMVGAGGTTFAVCQGALGRWKAIRSGAADAIANVTYYR